jgi:hypothetical protein
MREEHLEFSHLVSNSDRSNMREEHLELSHLVSNSVFFNLVVLSFIVRVKNSRANSLEVGKNVIPQFSYNIDII